MSRFTAPRSSLPGIFKVGPTPNAGHIVAPGKGPSNPPRKDSLVKGRPTGAPRIIRRPGQ